jgi:hypothetical protein
MDREQLADLLFETARARAAEHGRHLGEGADAHLHEMTVRGAAELMEVADEADRAGQIDEAKANLKRLIDDAAAGARTLSDYPDDLLGERSYFPAVFRFCPCPPFCR